MSDRKLTNKERVAIAHALDHLRANKIFNPNEYGGWYWGNREQFIKRHVKSIAILESMLKEKIRE